MCPLGTHSQFLVCTPEFHIPSPLDLFLTGRPQSLRILSHCPPLPVFLLTHIVLVFPSHCFPVQLIPMLYSNTPSQSPQGYNSTNFFVTAVFFIQTLELLFAAQFSASYNHTPTLLPLCTHIIDPEMCAEPYWWVERDKIQALKNGIEKKSSSFQPFL